MSFKPVIQGKTAAILEKEALHYGVTGTALALAIVDTVTREGIIHETLAGVDIKEIATRGRSRPNAKQYVFRGEMLTASAISKASGVDVHVFNKRVRRGWSVERAATTPVGPIGNPNWGRASQ